MAKLLLKKGNKNCTDLDEQLLIGTFWEKQLVWLQGNACLIKGACKMLVKLMSKMPITSRGRCYIRIPYR